MNPIALLIFGYSMCKLATVEGINRILWGVLAMISYTYCIFYACGI